MTFKQVNKHRMQLSVLKYLNVEQGKHKRNYKHTIPYLSDGHDNDKDDRSEPINGVIDEQLAHRRAQGQYNAVRHKPGRVKHDLTEGQRDKEIYRYKGSITTDTRHDLPPSSDRYR